MFNSKLEWVLEKVFNIKHRIFGKLVNTQQYKFKNSFKMWGVGFEPT